MVIVHLTVLKTKRNVCQRKTWKFRLTRRDSPIVVIAGAVTEWVCRGDQAVFGFVLEDISVSEGIAILGNCSFGIDRFLQAIAPATRLSDRML
jgi:hypothetical protein